MKLLFLKYAFAVFFLGISSTLFSQDNITHEVYFNTDSYSVKYTEESRLIAFIDEIKHVNIEKIQIFGFCDDRGTDAYNLKLSNQRAKAIKDFFVAFEIDPNIITNTDGKGEVLLRHVNASTFDIQRRLNRKTEIIITPKKEVEIEEIIEDEHVNETVEVLKNELEIGDKITLKNILFKNGYSVILPESKETLEEIAAVLVERDDIYFTIQGHVCCTYKTRDAIDAETKKRNLSFARAKFIYDYLVKKGVKYNRMKYEGLKRKFPLGGDPKLDRRVEIKITYIANRDE